MGQCRNYLIFFQVDSRWDKYDKDEWDFIEKRIAYSLFGAPKHPITPVTRQHLLWGYSDQEKKTAQSLIKQISSKIGGEIGITFGNILICYRTSKSEVEPNQEPIFRVVAVNGNKDYDFLIDKKTRIYSDWQHFLDTNKLPSGEMCCPASGVYMFSENGYPRIDFLPNQAQFSIWQIIEKIRSTLDIIMNIATVLGFGPAVMQTSVSLFQDVTLAVNFSSIFCWILGAISALCLIKVGIDMFDRITHKQDMNLFNEQGLENWKEILLEAWEPLISILEMFAPLHKYVNIAIKTSNKNVKKFLQMLQELLNHLDSSNSFDNKLIKMIKSILQNCHMC